MSLDILSKTFIENRLNGLNIDIPIDIRESVTSTNDVLKDFAKGNKPRVLIATEQTLGKGRRGRSFYSPKGSGLYISFLLYPDIPIDEFPIYTTIAAVATARAIENATGLFTKIKWVNDIYMRGKKVCGILTEAGSVRGDNKPEYIIVGIGINLYEPAGGFPKELLGKAGAVYDFPAGKNMPNEAGLENRLASALIIYFMEYFNKGIYDKTFITDYEKRCFVIGKDVALMSPDHLITDLNPCGTKVHVLGIDDRCHLHVRFADGHEEYLSGGEISVVVDDS